MRFLLVLLFVAVAYAKHHTHYQQRRSEDCPTACPYNYAPLCGRNQNGHLRTFGNDCDLKAYNCQNPDSVYEYVGHGSCEEQSHESCPKWCTKEYRPVCGRNEEGDLRTFANPCEMKSYNCIHSDSPYKYVKDGGCLQQETCPKVCPAVYAPVCAKNSAGHQRTFSNKCILVAFNCNNSDSQYELEREESC